LLAFKDVESMEKLPAKHSIPNDLSERDTASLVIHYQDGDGDLFRNSLTDGANFIWSTYYFDTDSNKFVLDGGSLNGYHALTILQPADGYYTGKSVEGDISIPLTEFRSSNLHKILKFEAFMIDMKNHKSNVVTSQTYSITF
jgi:hypothetical protein